jgi:hypothetical protein
MVLGILLALGGSITGEGVSDGPLNYSKDNLNIYENPELLTSSDAHLEG